MKYSQSKDIKKIKKLIEKNYEQFEDFMSKLEFKKYLKNYIDEMKSYGEDTKYTEKEILEDFFTYVKES